MWLPSMITLARRDAATLGKLYNFLGLSVGVVVPGMPAR